MSGMKKIILLLVSTLVSGQAWGEPLAVGDKAPEMTVMTSAGEIVDLADAYKEGMVLFFFFPKSGTRGCTAQACNLRDNRSVLEEAGISVFGVSTDSEKLQTLFIKEEGLNFTLVSDTEGKLGEAFGVPFRREFYYQRQSFLVRDGVVIWRDLKVIPETQTEDVLAALKELESEKSG